jgi:hypothetical protein
MDNILSISRLRIDDYSQAAVNCSLFWDTSNSSQNLSDFLREPNNILLVAEVEGQQVDLPHQKSTRNKMVPHIKIYPKYFGYPPPRLSKQPVGEDIYGAYYERKKGTHQTNSGTVPPVGEEKEGQDSR